MSKRVIVSGMSGAGANTVLRTLEDLGYFSIDNLPFFLLNILLSEAGKRNFADEGLALAMDCRDPGFPPEIHLLTDLKSEYSLEIIFLEADEMNLIKRFSEHRRRHPLSREDSLQDSIAAERKKLAPIKEVADMVINTGGLLPRELQQRVTDYLGRGDVTGSLKINLVSFGYKHGIPPEADIVWDVRFLPNPHYQENLRPYTGQDSDVADFVLKNDIAASFLNRLEQLMLDLIPRYRQEGKARLTIALGCTGGRHRSVAVVEEMNSFLSRHFGSLSVFHRDMVRQ
ncbi:MAG: RNase adapter RapZ [Desulfurivibrionaceae bacterium]